MPAPPGATASPAWSPVRAGRERRAPAAGGYLVEHLRLSGAAAADLQLLLLRPAGLTEPVTVLGAVLLIMSVVGFTRTLQRTYQAAWQLPAQGVRGFAHGWAARRPWSPRSPSSC